MAVGKGVQVRPSVAVSNRFIHASRSECAFARSEAQSSGEVGSSVVELTEACFRLRRHARMWRRSVYAASARLAAVTVVRSIARATSQQQSGVAVAAEYPLFKIPPSAVGAQAPGPSKALVTTKPLTCPGRAFIQ